MESGESCCLTWTGELELFSLCWVGFSKVQFFLILSILCVGRGCGCHLVCVCVCVCMCVLLCVYVCKCSKVHMYMYWHEKYNKIGFFLPSCPNLLLMQAKQNVSIYPLASINTCPLTGCTHSVIEELRDKS